MWLAEEKNMNTQKGFLYYFRRLFSHCLIKLGNKNAQIAPSTSRSDSLH